MYKGQPESTKLDNAIVRALDELGPVRTLEILADRFMGMQGDRREDYLEALDHIVNAARVFSR